MSAALQAVIRKEPENARVFSLPTSEGAVSETVSENISEKRRGRPPVFDDFFLNALKSRSQNIRTRRGLQNRAWATMAIFALEEDFPWLLTEERARWTILGELGRWRDKDDIRFLAGELCRTKPRTEDAVPRLRNLRLRYGDEEEP